MVARVGEFRETEAGVKQADRVWAIAGGVVGTLFALPLERLLLSGRPKDAPKQKALPASNPSVTSKPAPPAEPPLMKPGCVAGDETGTVLYHLQGLAAGWGGFGVLKTSKDRLDRAAKGAELMGDSATADEIRQFSNRLPEVHSEAEARKAAQELVPIAQKAWELGKVCGRRKLPGEGERAPG